MNSQKSDGLRAVIVEDEPPMLRFLYRLVSRTEIFTAIAQCTNAEEALPVIGQQKPQLLISDIRMTGMSGLALAEKVRKLSPDIHIVIITGYKSFEYAKTAIDLNIDAFITKPVDQAELRDVLLKIRDACLTKRYTAARSLLEKAFLTDDESLFARQLEDLGCLPCRVLMVYYTGDMAQLFDCITRIEKRIYWIHYKNSVVFLADQTSSAELFRYICAKFSGAPRQKRTAVCIRLEPAPGAELTIAGIKDFYRTRLLQSIIPGSFCTCSGTSSVSGDSPETGGDEGLCSQLELSILSRNRQRLMQGLKQLFTLWQEHQVTVACLRKRIHWIIALCEKAGILNTERISLNDRIDEDILCLDSYEEIKCYITGILDENLSMDRPSAAKSDRELFGQIKDLVLQNLEHNYSLQEICGMFHVSQPYVRKTFIRYTGKTYNDFVLDEKIAHAVKLIGSNPAIPVKDLALALGYEQLYFSTVFKKKVGVTPSQYRQSITPADQTGEDRRI